MTTYRTLIALCVATLAAACASQGSMNASPMSSGMAPANAMPMAADEPRMVAMKAMHEKMMSAKTPAERQALMAEHTAMMSIMMDMVAQRLPMAP